jgi:hypothetical protein
MNGAYEETKGRAICAAIRLAVLFTGSITLFPAGAWLMLEAAGLGQWAGGLLCAIGGMLASGIPAEKQRAERLTREAERLKGQVISDQ